MVIMFSMSAPFQCMVSQCIICVCDLFHCIYFIVSISIIYFNVWYPSASYVCVIYFIVSISLYLFQSSISMYDIPVYHMCA